MIYRAFELTCFYMTGTLAVDRLKLLLECNFQTDTISFLTAFVLTKKEKLRQKFFHHCKVCRCIKLVFIFENITV